MINVSFRRFEKSDAEAVSKLVIRNFKEVNIKDYPKEEIEHLVEIFTPEKVIKRSEVSHFYVACVDNVQVGCGSIAPFWDKEDESILLTIFVLPEMHGRGIGKKIIEVLEADEYFLRAKRIEIPASITACEFYRKLGYDYKNSMSELDKEGLYRLEKFN